MNDISVPKWRKDFPIQQVDSSYITRREFTKFLVLASGATFVGNGYFLLNKQRKQKIISPAQQIAVAEEIAENEVKQFYYPTDNDPAILIRLKNTFVAYQQRCTHLSCPVHFSASNGRIECPCHNGAFEAETGKVLEGPPPRPLPHIKLRIDNGKIFAVGVEQS